MSVLLYDSAEQAFKDAGVPKVYNGSEYADAGGKVWNGTEWVDAIGGRAILTVGSVYTLDGTNTTANAPIKAVCIQMDQTNMTAVMQSYGFGHGSWPGAGTFAASSYGTSTGNFNISNVCLPKGTSSSSLTACGVSGQSSLIHTALVDAASHHSSFGTSISYSWLGTPNGGSGAYYVNSDGGVINGTKRTYNYVVAPCFVLSLSNVKLDKTTPTILIAK